ncbi:sigma-70 family RNA polymerase sigma factor [Pseudomonas sp. Au-Pse12]|uniref:sigma-70 family RNA polymerase sigma factor n=1 Tax=Pseudomonas sp. Au-Pse12 TaxID=2906459 RepID=UPI001E3FD015|nr:sigma-70 family RNA polymerase sigma factor [Pseudomonas sp. Au-Pse12]MCE4056474.1 sigma-70 family RNA polymerase sigma factor [Pseudomonas sp. Au-Pse12]
MSDLGFFLDQRPRLHALAYRLLGSLSEADDVLQELWLRWQALDLQPLNPQAYLTRMLSNLCIDQLRGRRQQVYVGPWLPEPQLDEHAASDRPEDLHGRWQTLSLAFLLVLEQLTPTQRVVWVLRELFGYPFAELGTVLGRSSVACRKLFQRAQLRLAEQAGQGAGDTDRQLAEDCLQACLSGDTEALLRLLASDAQLLSDGGGQVRAALRPIEGVQPILRFILGVRSKFNAGFSVRVALCNGLPALLVFDRQRLDLLLTCEVRGQQVVRLLLVRNPQKLRGLAQALSGVIPAD